MLHMMPIPPIHGTGAIDAGAIWGMIGFVLAVLLVVSLWAIGVARSQKNAQWQAKMKEPEQVQAGEQLPVSASEEEKESLVRIPSLT